MKQSRTYARVRKPAAIQSNQGTKLIEILRLSHKGNREIKSNVNPLARITNNLSARSREIREINSTRGHMFAIETATPTLQKRKHRI